LAGPGEIAFALGSTVGVGGMLVRRSRQARRAASAPTVAREHGLDIVEYLIGAVVCTCLLLGGSSVTRALHDGVENWFAGWEARSVFYATTGLLLALSFAYSQVVAAAAVRAMNHALEHDWKVTRNQHYALLVPPFAVVAATNPVPSILAGIGAQLANLLLCWRYTDERPQTPLQTLKAIQARRKQRGPARIA
jgi:hypothetical protein